MQWTQNRYHAGISKCEWMLRREDGRGWFWDKRRHVHHTTTYGMARGRFGGWVYERNHRLQRLRMRREWRKRARREAKQWLQEQMP